MADEKAEPGVEAAGTRKRFILWLVALVVILGFLGGGMYLSLLGYRQEKLQRDTTYDYPDAAAFQNGIEGVYLFVRFMSIDPISGEASLQVACRPAGGYASGGDLTKRLRLYTNNIHGEQYQVFPEGQEMSPSRVTINLYDGQASDYPFDRFNVDLDFQMKELDNKGKASRLVPIAMDVQSLVQGFTVTPTEADTKTAGYIHVQMSVSRSATVRVTAIAGMVVMWAIAFAVLSLTLSILFLGQKAEPFTFFAGLLFALFSFRNSLPATPPVGTLSDFLSFFWAEAIVSLSLIVTIVHSIVRRKADDEEADSTD